LSSTDKLHLLYRRWHLEKKNCIQTGACPIFPILIFSVILPSWNRCIHHRILTVYLSRAFTSGKSSLPCTG